MQSVDWSLSALSTKASLQPGPLGVSFQNLNDFYMTDSISRASPPIAHCVAAVKADNVSAGTANFNIM